jgi:hypothetical protein
MRPRGPIRWQIACQGNGAPSRAAARRSRVCAVALDPCRSAILGALVEPFGIGSKCAARSRIYQVCANQVVDRRIGFSLDAFQQIAAPGFKVVDPTLHFEAIVAQFFHAECSRPAVVHQGLHGYLGPLIRTFAVNQQRGGDRVVPVGEDICFHADLIAQSAFCGESPPSISGRNPQSPRACVHRSESLPSFVPCSFRL